MTIHRRLNQACLGGNHSTWWIIKTMLDAGWTVPLSGSGTGGLYATSNVFDVAQTPKQYSLLDPNGVGVGSEPWGHPGCWAVLEDPSGNRQILFKRGPTTADTGDQYLYGAYSPRGTFGSGQVAGTDWDEDTTPLATDQLNLLGTDASPSLIFRTGGLASLIQVVADDTPSPEGEYGVAALDFIATNNNYASFMIDDFREVAPGHPHPLGVWLTPNDNPWTDGYLSGTSVAAAPYGIAAYDSDGEFFGYMYYMHSRFGAAIKIPGSGIVDADGNERVFAIPVGWRDSEQYIGISRWLYWSSVAARSYPDTANSLQHMFVAECLFKDFLDGVTTPSSI